MRLTRPTGPRAPDPAGDSGALLPVAAQGGRLGDIVSAHLWVCFANPGARPASGWPMALYSLNHKSIGKSTQAQPHTAAAHIRYISRERAVGRIDGARMPTRGGEAASYLQEAEDRDRKNARVIDKFMVALPRELSADERAELVRGFAEDLTKGRAPWFAAFHDKGKDARNPHCHLVVRDRDPKTGKRVIGLSETGSTNPVRELWESHVNLALERAGRRERVDRRTLKAQGIDREPTIHVGVRAKELMHRGGKPFSRVRKVRNGCQARTRYRQVDFVAIDKGNTRLGYNVALTRANIRRSRGQGSEKDLWAAIDRDSFERDMNLLRRAHGVVREREYGRLDPAPDIDMDFDR